MTTSSSVLDSSALRSPRQTLREICGLGIALTVIVLALLPIPYGTAMMSRLWERAGDIGAVIAENIGWGFGVFVPVLLGFYVVIIGGELTGSTDAAETRRTLGYVAELMAASYVPVLLLMVVSAVNDPPSAGVFFIAIPATVLMFFLAVQLGVFFIADLDVRRDATQRTLNEARAQLRKLEPTGTRPAALVLGVNIVVGWAVPVIVTCFDLPASPRDSWIVFGIYGAISAVVNVVGLCAAVLVFVSRDAPGRVMPWAFGTLSYLFFSAIAIGLVVADPTLVIPSVSIFSTAALGTASVLLRRRRVHGWLSPWLVNTAARSLAARHVRRRRDRAARELSALNVALAEATRRSLVTRLQDAVRELRRSS